MKKVGLTKGGFYRHFRSKDDLFVEAVARAFDEMGKVRGFAMIACCPMSMTRASTYINAWMRRADLLRAGRAEQISAKARMAYHAVADDIDERGLARVQCMFKSRAKLLRPLDVFTVAIHELEHPVVALVR